jgi:hypothetical protein
MEATKSPDSDRGEPELKASDVREAAGLSYRQLNDWDGKGALPGKREGQAGWRRFSARDVFALMVCSEIRKRFGVPVESLRFVRDFMLQEGADHLRAAVEMKALGLSVWLMTDLRETFDMDTDLEFTNMLALGLLRSDTAPGYVFLNLNPLVNKLLAALKKPVQLPVLHEVYAGLDALHAERSVMSDEELEVLRLLRERDYTRVTIERKDGEIVGASVEKELIEPGRTATDEELKAIISSHDYQTVTVKMHGGRVVRLTQTVHLKTTKAREGSPASRATATQRKATDRRSRSKRPRTS